MAYGEKIVDFWGVPPFGAILHYFAQNGCPGSLGSEASAHEVTTHPYLPRRLRNMYLRSNTTQMIIIEATPGIWGGGYLVSTRIIAPIHPFWAK